MRRKKGSSHMVKRFVLATPCLALAACGTFQAQSRVDPIRIASYHSVRDACVEQAFPRDRRGGATNLDCFRFDGDTYTAYQLAKRDAAYRNRLASYLIGESNTVCTRELGDLTANQAMVNAGLGILTTAFGTAGSIVTGQLASNILSGAASGTNATRDHINAEVYRNQISPRVTRAIRDLRRTQSATLKGKFTKTILQYDVETMIADVNDYHQLCSYYVGLDLILKDVDRAALERANPRRTASLAISNVRAQIASVNRQLGRKGLSAEERTELQQQRTALRAHETQLITTWTALPESAEDPAPPPPAPAPEPEPETEPDPN
jgi:hypothetical protein